MPAAALLHVCRRCHGCSITAVLAHMQVDTETMDMLRTMNMANLPGVKLQQVTLLGLPLV